MAHGSSEGSDIRRRETLMWRDPDEQRHGVLLSDRIAFYADAVGLVHPFVRERLGPASYDLTLGSDCWYADHVEATGDSKRTLAPGEKLVIEPNSIVYITSAESLNLPFYLVGRFNLKLRLLHEGLLVGTGPQVDPGFVGRLSCPLHNISSSRVSIACGETFAVLEFQKTTPFAESKTWAGMEDLDEIRHRGEAGALKGIQGIPCITFPTKSLNREPVKRYVPAGRLVTSSMQGLAKKVDLFEKTTVGKIDDFKRNLSVVNIGAIVAVATVAISLGTYFWGAFATYRGVYDTAAQAIERIRVSDLERQRLEQRVQALEAQLDSLQRSASATTPPARTGGPASARQ